MNDDDDLTERLELLDRQYTPPIPGLPIEVTTVTEMRRRRDVLMRRPGRVFFHVILICTDGEGLHEVDFTPVILQPRRVVHIRPGQVHRWRFGRSYSATVVMFSDTMNTLRGPGWPVGPRWYDLEDHEWNRTKDVLRMIRHEMKLDRSSERRDRALNGALQMLIVNLGLDLSRRQDTANLPKPYVELLNQMENEAGWSRSAKERAKHLGYSQRTLTRACLTATGRTAKEVIDDRVALEAQRLLVDSDQPISNVADHLSFSEPNNFSKFFHRMTGATPSDWRDHHRVGSS